MYLRHVTIAGNSATRFGGGILMGDMQSASCGLVMQDCVIADNTAGSGGSQYYSTSSGVAVFANSSIGLNSGESQVRVGLWNVPLERNVNVPLERNLVLPLKDLTCVQLPRWTSCLAGISRSPRDRC